MTDQRPQSAETAKKHYLINTKAWLRGYALWISLSVATLAKAVLHREHMHILADKAYFSTLELLACHEAGITATVPRSDTSGARSKGHFAKADFAYENDADVYRCPAGQVLIYRTTSEQQGLQMRRYRTNACKPSALRSRCTTGHERRVSRGEHEHLVEASNARSRSLSVPMSVRCSTVEHPFGTIKSWTGSCHFLTRWLRGVRTEMALNLLAYNIKRMIALVGIKGLMGAIPGQIGPPLASIDGSECYKASPRPPDASKTNSIRNQLSGRNRTPRGSNRRGSTQPSPKAYRSGRTNGKTSHGAHRSSGAADLISVCAL